MKNNRTDDVNLVIVAAGKESGEAPHEMLRPRGTARGLDCAAQRPLPQGLT
jgi:hypothetical protein